ncbi:MAG: UvrD-helicase domain-containing protein, partial [Fibrobacterota bacterium]
METELISTLISLRNKEKECKADSDKQCLCAAQHLAWTMAQAAAHDIRQYKMEHSLLEFDDLIFHLHRVVCDASPHGRDVADAISRDYKALFIDEFQDTDRRQFEILNALFEEKPCFYIGDPKQSIYGWRGADLDTYFMVRREKIDALYSMKECFRSTPKLVHSFNTFFGATRTFFEHPELTYTEVEGKNDTPWDTPPLTVYTGGTKKDEIIALSADRITQFLIEHREVSLEKCAVLVRAHREAADIKAALARRGVPAVTIDDSSLFATKAAEDLQGVLEALVSGEDRQFRRALISPLCGFSAQDIAAMPAETYEEHLRRFRIFAQTWEEHGLAAALTTLISEYALRERVFVYSSLEQGERFFADLMHLMDCLVFETVKNGLSVEEQLLFLQRQIGKETSQKRRVENDSNSLQIVTIHKSKGLTYDHVFCPFLNNAPKKKKPAPLTLVKTDRGYRFTDPDQDQDDLKKEALQENRRLIYVAMTRARFSCTLCIGAKVKDGTVNLAEGALKECVENVGDNSAIQIIPLDVQDITDVRYTAPEESLPGTKRELKHRENLISRRDISSFSALSRMHGLPPADSLETEH